MRKSNTLRFSGVFYELSVLTVDSDENKELFDFVKLNHKIPQRYSEIEEKLRNQSEWAGYVRFKSIDMFSLNLNGNSLRIPNKRTVHRDRLDRCSHNSIFFHKISTASIHEIEIGDEYHVSKFECIGEETTRFFDDRVVLFTPYYKGEYFECTSSETYVEYFSVEDTTNSNKETVACDM